MPTASKTTTKNAKQTGNTKTGAAQQSEKKVAKQATKKTKSDEEPVEDGDDVVSPQANQDETVDPNEKNTRIIKFAEHSNTRMALVRWIWKNKMENSIYFPKYLHGGKIRKVIMLLSQKMEVLRWS